LLAIAAPAYAASGATLIEPDDHVKVSPVVTVFATANASEVRNVPAALADHNEKWLIVSGEVPAHDAHDGNVAANAHDPADAAENVVAGRVVTDDTAVVPAAPGSAVCNWVKQPAGAVDAICRNM
jgi:hypothetical protein